KAIAGVEREAADLLFSYAWPGNLRELTRVIDAAVALTSGEFLAPAALLLQSAGSPPAEATPPLAGTGRPGSGGDGVLTLAEAERRHVRDVLASFGGNKR